MRLLGPSTREILLRIWLRRLPRWYMRWGGRTIWRREVAGRNGHRPGVMYMYLWPDGLFRRERPQSWLREHIQGNASCWRILDISDRLPTGVKPMMLVEFRDRKGRIASLGMKGPWWLS